MRLDLCLRVRRDRINLAIRLRSIAGGAVIVSIVLALTGIAPRLSDLHRQPLIVIAPPATVPQAAASWRPAS